MTGPQQLTHAVPSRLTAAKHDTLKAERCKYIYYLLETMQKHKLTQNLKLTHHPVQYPPFRTSDEKILITVR